MGLGVVRIEVEVSIRALREEGDRQRPGGFQSTSRFNPRPPRGGRLRGYSISSCGCCFNPRPPGGGRP